MDTSSNLDLKGTIFQVKVWRACAKIPFGKTITYGQLAKRIGHPKAARAVGTALKKNPYPIKIPCHRVVPTNADLVNNFGNYDGGKNNGPARKARLIKHERSVKEAAKK